MMANGSDTAVPWDKNSKSGQAILRLLPSQEAWLNQKVPLLKKVVKLENMWVHFFSLDVLSTQERDTIQLGAPNHTQVERLCEFLMTSPVWKWHAFLRCLVLSGQKAIIAELGLQIASYQVPGEASITPAPPPVVPDPDVKMDPHVASAIPRALASSGNNQPMYRLWVQRRPGALDLVSKGDKNRVNKTRTQIIEAMADSISLLWDKLIELDVVDAKKKRQIQLNATAEDQVAGLLDYVTTGPDWRFHAFLRACGTENLDAVIYLIGLNVDYYTQED